jgi:hypothetical protein
MRATTIMPAMRSQRTFGRLVSAGLIAIVAVGVVPSSVSASQEVNPATFNRVSSGVALIRTYGCGGKLLGQGTGFLVGTSVLMTARHVVKGACRVRVRVGGDSFSGTRWVSWHGGGASPSAADIATIKLDRAADGFVFRVRSAPLALGMNLGMVGYPLGNRLSLNQGKLIMRGKVGGAPLLAVRMLGAEGASGAPIIDDNGRVVGIVQIGLGSEDVLGQRTSGVLVGLDLVRWWGPRARLDLCRAYPKGGIAGCPGSAPAPPPTTAITVTSAYLSSTEDGNDPQTSFPSVANFIAYLQLDFASPVKGPHTIVVDSVGPGGSALNQCSGPLGVGWEGVTCEIELGDYPAPGAWRVLYSIDGNPRRTVSFQVTSSPPPPSAAPHIQQCWAQDTGGSSSNWNPASAITTVSGNDILSRGPTSYREIAWLDRFPSTDILGVVTLTLIQPNGQVFAATTVANWQAQYQGYGYDFNWRWSDGTLFFQHPERAGQGTWRFQWRGPDGQVCSNAITVS